MERNMNEGSAELLASVVNAISAANRTTQLRLFHGLVPAVAALRAVGEGLDSLKRPGTFRSKRRTDAECLVHALSAHLEDAVRVIEARAAELHYPLDNALANYQATGASLNTLAAMEAALADLGCADWNAWAASLTEEPGDAAA